LADNYNGSAPNSLELPQPITVAISDTGSSTFLEVQGYTSDFVIVLEQNRYGTSTNLP
jgi:hypothetical protein